MDFDKIASKMDTYATLASLGATAVAALLKAYTRAQEDPTTEAEVDAEIARIDNEIQTASERDWSRLRDSTE